jgi:murein DD-endopeptidase MepM/ murein hydrolase activator NlpD
MATCWVLFTMAGMDLLSLLNTPAAGVNSTSANQSSTSTAATGQNFQQMLMNMLSSSASSGTSTGDTSSDPDPLGSSMSSLMMPIMYSMLEQLIMKQMEQLQSAQPAATSTPADATTAAQTQPTELRQPAILVANQARATAAASTASTQPAVPVVNPLPAASPVIPASDPGVIGSSSHAVPYGEPVHGPLTQTFHPGHIGLDIGVVTGTPIKSTMDGKVIFAGWNTIGYGNLVIVQNGDYQTYYAHQSKIQVNVGQTVQAGNVLGLSGSTGNSTGPHLHYEIRYKGTPIDPTSTTLNKSI